MKLFYTEVGTHLTEFLAKEAEKFATEGKRVFYIAPNSLSFEKEKQVLSHLEGQASFDVMVTRFAQMARYFTLNEVSFEKGIDDMGMAMIFFRILSQMDDSELQVYGKLKQDMDFIQQLVSLYKEMQLSNLTVADLAAIDSAEKKEDLRKIFLAFEAILTEQGYTSETKIAHFTRLVESGKLDEELANIVLVVDGFTRFSAEEEALIAALHSRVAEIVIAVYASQKAYKASYIEGNLYQASVEFLGQLASRFGVKAEFIPSAHPLDSLGRISKNLESYYDFSGEYLELTDDDKKRVQLWEVSNQKEEVEQVARAIRRDLEAGYRYKDILVLLGDVEAYKLQIGKTFAQYEIPFYLGRAEEMSHHPLVHFIESLERLKRYRFRTEDMLNLLKSGLYGQLTQAELDKFEQYVLFADIKGQAKFAKDFTVNSRAKYDLETLNGVRKTIMEPLLVFFKAQPQSGASLLQKLMDFLAAVNLPENMQTLSAGLDEIELEKEEQVWKAFVHILETMQEIFGKEKLRLDDFLALLRSGMLAITYRIVPATVDVVNVKSYDLIEPQSNKLVYVLGLSKSNFPKIAKNTSLLTEEERVQINETSSDIAHFDVVTQENIKKNHFTMLSLVNAATERLVLSRPQIFNEAEDTISPYLKLLQEMGIPVEEKGRSQQLESNSIGHYKGLLSRVIVANQVEFEGKDWTKEEQTFWSVMIRYLRKKLENENVAIPTISEDLETQALSDEALAILYPVNQPLQLSASSLTDFYKNEYLYFLRHVLRLEEQESIHPDARSHGNFLHRIFERVMTDKTGDFDEKLARAISETRKEPVFEALYQNDAESQFSEEILLDVARATSLVLRDDSVIEVLADEAVFGVDNSNLLTLDNGRTVNIGGKIDRLDAIKADGAIGIVDYKSSSNAFKLDRFYNGLSPQLMTYIAAIKNAPEYSQTEKIFGAMYLHMLDPIVKLKDTKGGDAILAEAYKSLVYKGLFLEEESNHLNQFYKTKNNLFNQEEMATLLAHNERLYKQAAGKILSGRFAMNPYMEDGKSVAGEQLRAITGFEANRHLSKARRLVKGGKREDWLERMKEEKGGQA